MDSPRTIIATPDEATRIHGIATAADLAIGETKEGPDYWVTARPSTWRALASLLDHDESDEPIQAKIAEVVK